MWLTKVSLSLLALAAFASAQYTGPCSTSNCGATGKVCPRGYLCVPWPSFNPAERQGCTCSYG
ncbi:hypothetical protein B0H66DRAFT_101179 [Apodospora peruviana]|uniref:Uncharacterized protein n=1 Tax=Apodospora peruviana TaxID=516989 RepID=A0AAE0HSQ8_9PEZI|nr:hypothetical protein B0H66DRAFT_101179 [Apodospora peruviana]